MELVASLRSLLGESKVNTNSTALEAAAIDESALIPVVPRAIVRAESAGDIEATIRFCNDQAVPVTVRAAGSALEGSAIPVAGGIVLDVSGLDKVIAFWPEDLQVKVEPGIVYEKLNDILKRESLFFPP